MATLTYKDKSYSLEEITEHINYLEGFRDIAEKNANTPIDKLLKARDEMAKRTFEDITGKMQITKRQFTLSKVFLIMLYDPKWLLEYFDLLDWFKEVVESGITSN